MKEEDILNYLKNNVDPDAPTEDILKAIIGVLVSPVKSIYLVESFTDYPTTAWEDSYIAELENGYSAVIWYGECGDSFCIFKNHTIAEIYAKHGFHEDFDVEEFSITAIVDYLRYGSSYNEAIQQIERILNADLSPQDDKVSITFDHLPEHERDSIKKQIISRLIGTEVKVNIDGGIKKGRIEDIDDVAFHDGKAQIDEATVCIEGKSAIVWRCSNNVQATEEITATTTDGVQIKLTVTIPEFEGVFL